MSASNKSNAKALIDEERRGLIDRYGGAAVNDIEDFARRAIEATSAPTAKALAEAMKKQHAVLMPSAPPLAEATVQAMAADLLRRLSSD